MANTNDYIRRGDAIEAVYERIKQIGCENNVDVLSIRQAIREVPSAQPEIILCKDCKWFCEMIHQCDRQVAAVMFENDFCSYAERRTDGEIH